MKGINEEPRNMTPGNAGNNRDGSGKDFPAAGSYLSVLGVVLFSTGFAFILETIDKSLSVPVHSANLVMPYLLGIVWSALKFDKPKALLSVILNVVSFSVVFIRPISMKQPDDFDYVLILIVFLIVAVVINELSFKARQQARLLQDTEAQIEKERMKNTLLRSVSHDLRSPLASIMGAASSLLDAGSRVSEAETKELAQSICRESKRLDRQVANLLEMTSLESGGLVLHKEWYALDEIVGNALTSLESALGSKDIALEVADDIPLLYVDGLLIEKVFINLLENSLKYAPDGKYFLKIVRVKDAIECEVFNTGQSIREGEEEKIFEKFYRSSSVSAESDGAGLGLAICRSIVNLHGGTIIAVPGLTDGVSMKFTLPVPKELPELQMEKEV